MMGIDNKLSKLEQRAKRTLRCDWCRYILCVVPPAKQKRYKADPTSHGSASCLYCGTIFTITLSGLDQYEREATILCYKHEWGSMYRDERFYAAMSWINNHRCIKEWKNGRLSKERITAITQWQEQQRKEKPDRYTRERAELKDRAYSFLQRMYEKEEKEFAPHSFPLAAEHDGIEKPPDHFAPGSYIQMTYEEKITRQMLYRVQQMELCERVLWGKVLLETEAVMVELNSIIEKFEADRVQRSRQP